MNIIATATVPGGAYLSTVDTGEIPRTESLTAAELAAYQHGQALGADTLTNCGDTNPRIQGLRLVQCLHVCRRAAALLGERVTDAFCDGIACVLEDHLADWYGSGADGDARAVAAVAAVEKLVAESVATFTAAHPGLTLDDDSTVVLVIDEPRSVNWRAAAVMFPEHPHGAVFGRLADLFETRERSGGAS